MTPDTLSRREIRGALLRGLAEIPEDHTDRVRAAVELCIADAAEQGADAREQAQLRRAFVDALNHDPKLWKHVRKAALAPVREVEKEIAGVRALLEAAAKKMGLGLDLGPLKPTVGIPIEAVVETGIP